MGQNCEAFQTSAAEIISGYFVYGIQLLKYHFNSEKYRKLQLLLFFGKIIFKRIYSVTSYISAGK